MATHVNQGNSIECSKSSVAVRKVSKTPEYMRLENLVGEFENVFKYKSNKRAIVKIVKELDPKECIICDTSFLDLDDVLEAEIIEIFTGKKISFEITSNFSNVHGIQGNTVNAFTYAKIVTPFRLFLERGKENSLLTA